MQFDSPETFEEFLETERIRFHQVGVVDIDGVIRGKYLSRDKLSSSLRAGFGFCDVVLGWDSGDQLYDNGKSSGWHTAYRDAPVALDLRTVRHIPGEPDTIFVLGEFTGAYAGACPRSLLGRVLTQAEALGYFPEAAFEYEFFVFDETPDSVREKQYRNLKPFTPGMFGYSTLRANVHSDLYRELLDEMQSMEIGIEGLHTETGPGVLEAALMHTPILEAADRAALFKTFTKVFLQKRGLMGTFMAKWSNDYPGQSGHFHLSLLNQEKRNVFHSESGDGFSDTFRHFVAGQTLLLPEVLPLVCSTVNSYRRLVPGMWAPTHANWGIENRTTAIRGIAGGEKAARSEYRIGPADGNPYLVAAAALATGLYGIEHKLTLNETQGSAYENPGPHPLPSTLRDATRAFTESKVTRQLFGEEFVDHFARTREWESRAAERYVSNFDLSRYFEII